MGTAMSSSPRQLAYQAKLRALVRDAFGASVDAADGFPGGAAARSGATGWVLAEEEARRSLGGAMAWAWQAGVTDLHLIAQADAAGLLARRAAAFAPESAPTVYLSVGREVEPAAPAPLSPPAPLPPLSEPYVSLFRELGTEPVVEDGVLLAEVLGLEVARVVDGELAVGVGKHDREAQKLMHPDRQPVEALAAAIEAVRELRRPDVPRHPMNQLAASRWLRAVVCADPSIVGASELRPVWSTVPRPDLRLPAPAPAAGPGIVVVCSTGIDVDLVPTAADEHLAHRGDGARLVLVMPEIDAHPLTRSLAAALREPAEVVTVPAGWRTAPEL